MPRKPKKVIGYETCQDCKGDVDLVLGRDKYIHGKCRTIDKSGKICGRVIKMSAIASMELLDECKANGWDIEQLYYEENGIYWNETVGE